MSSQKRKSINWEIDVKILNNMRVIKEILKVLGIATSFLILFVTILWAIDGFPPIIDFEDSKYAILLIFIVLVITVLFILFTGNKYPTRYEITPRGVTLITLSKQKKKNKIVGAILFLLGTIKGNPTNMGIGIISSTRHNMYTEWKKVKKVVFHKKAMAISLISSDMRKNILFCHEDNAHEVFETVVFYCSNARVITKK